MAAVSKVAGVADVLFGTRLAVDDWVRAARDALRNNARMLAPIEARLRVLVIRILFADTESVDGLKAVMILLDDARTVALEVDPAHDTMIAYYADKALGRCVGAIAALGSCASAGDIGEDAARALLHGAGFR